MFIYFKKDNKIDNLYGPCKQNSMSIKITYKIKLFFRVDKMFSLAQFYVWNSNILFAMQKKYLSHYAEHII